MMLSHATTTNHPSQRLRPAGLLLAGLLLLGLACVPRVALADCWVPPGQVLTPSTVTFSQPQQIILHAGMTPGQVIGTQVPASPVSTPHLMCNGNTSSGLVNTVAGAPTGSNNTLFPSGVPGISYRILHPDTTKELAAYPNYPVGAGTSDFNDAFSLQLVYTGPLPPAGSSLVGQLGQWKVDNICDDPDIRGKGNQPSEYKGCNGPLTSKVVETFITAPISLVSPTCSVDTNPTVVPLADVMTSAFSGPGSTTGQQPFRIQLTGCSANLKVSVAIDATNKVPGAPGVIAPTSGPGYAQGIGVQLLKDDGTAVPFGTSFLTGTTGGSLYDIPLKARYYQTDALISSGDVKATATYTLTYQ